MSLKLFLILMTVIAVISDSMLHPFYPQYFASVFAVTDPEHVGNYIATCSLVVILSFPVWALIAKRIPVLRLLVGTQLATCALSLACYSTTSLLQFWLLSQAMMVFKASYLLIYPYVLSLDDKKNHMGTISLLAFVVYFGNILASLLSGTVFELLEPRLLFVAMAGGDVLQILVCLYLLRLPEFSKDREEPDRASEQAAAPVPGLFVYKLGVVMFVLYFSAYVTEPFFSSYWEALTAIDNKILSGIVFAIPGIAALLALWVNARGGKDEPAHVGILPAIVLGICGLLLEVQGQQVVVVSGRFLYGWALFQSMVRLDVLLFRLSTPETYAIDFSKINLFQGFGVLSASFAAGSLVGSFDARTPFLVAASGFLMGSLLYSVLLRKELRADAEPALTLSEQRKSHGTV